MKIKELVDKFDKNKYKKWIELFHQENNNYNLAKHYLTQLVMLSFLEQHNLIDDLDYYKDNLIDLLKDVKIEEYWQIDWEFSKLYNPKCKVRYLHFSYNIKKINLDCTYIPTFSDFIYKWFANLFISEIYYITKKDLNKILNTEI